MQTMLLRTGMEKYINILSFQKVTEFARHYISRQTLHTDLHYCEILEMYAHVASGSTLKVIQNKQGHSKR